MKRLITVVVTLTMLLTLAACSSNTSSDSGAAENDAQTEGTGYQVGYANLADSDVNCRLTKEYFLEYAKQHEGMEVLASDDNNSAVVADLSYGDYVITTSNSPVKSGDQVRMAENNT